MADRPASTKRAIRPTELNGLEVLGLVRRSPLFTVLFSSIMRASQASSVILRRQESWPLLMEWRCNHRMLWSFVMSFVPIIPISKSLTVPGERNNITLDI